MIRSVVTFLGEAIGPWSSSNSRLCGNLALLRAIYGIAGKTLGSQRNRPQEKTVKLGVSAGGTQSRFEACSLGE